MKTYNLKSMPAATCRVEMYEKDDATVVLLRSYDTRVLALEFYPDELNNNPRIEVHSNGTYSATTSRHINRFTTEFLGVNHYHDIKHALGLDGYDYIGTTVLCMVITAKSVIDHFLTTLHKYTCD